MTIDDCVDYILTAPEVVKNFDVVSFCKCQGKNALRFKKEINGITYITLIIISNRHKTFNIRTAFMLKKDFEAKKEILSPNFAESS